LLSRAKEEINVSPEMAENSGDRGPPCSHAEKRKGRHEDQRWVGGLSPAPYKKKKTRPNSLFLARSRGRGKGPPSRAQDGPVCAKFWRFRKGGDAGICDLRWVFRKTRSKKSVGKNWLAPGGKDSTHQKEILRTENPLMQTKGGRKSRGPIWVLRLKRQPRGTKTGVDSTAVRSKTE